MSKQTVFYRWCLKWDDKTPSSTDNYVWIIGILKKALTKWILSCFRQVLKFTLLLRFAAAFESSRANGLFWNFFLFSARQDTQVSAFPSVNCQHSFHQRQKYVDTFLLHNCFSKNVTKKSPTCMQMQISAYSIMYQYLYTYNLVGNLNVHLGIFIHARNLYAHIQYQLWH